MKLGKKMIVLFVLVLFSITTFGQDTLSLTHVAGDLTVTMYDEGSIGTYTSGNGATPGITWKGENGLWFGGIIFGTSDKSSINGLVGSFNEISNGKLLTDIVKVKSNFGTGFTSDNNFNQISATTFNDSGADSPYGVEVIQKTYSHTSDQFVLISYGFINKSTTTALNNFYAGIFIDWDVLPGISTNVGGYDAATSLVYVTDQAANSKYFGIVGCNSIDGYSINSFNPPAGSNISTRKEIFKFISTKDTASVSTPADLRTFQGTKLGNIAAGDTSWVTFGVVAGDNLAGIKANATAAKAKAQSSGLIITSIKKEDVMPIHFYVDQNYPNPFNPTTKISFGLANKSNVDLRIYDMLGREVAVLINHKLLGAGTYNADFNAGNLASGSYIYTLKTNNHIISKKMLLLK